jgi:hypothetical protein
VYFFNKNKSNIIIFEKNNNLFKLLNSYFNYNNKSNNLKKINILYKPINILNKINYKCKDYYNSHIKYIIKIISCEHKYIIFKKIKLFT